MTPHVCLKTHHVRDRTSELRPITTKIYIVRNLKHNLFSGKMLHKTGYKIMLGGDPEETGLLVFFGVNDGKICKSSSLPFMIEHLNVLSLNRTNIFIRHAPH